MLSHFFDRIALTALPLVMGYSQRVAHYLTARISSRNHKENWGFHPQLERVLRGDPPRASKINPAAYSEHSLGSIIGRSFSCQSSGML